MSNIQLHSVGDSVLFIVMSSSYDPLLSRGFVLGEPVEALHQKPEVSVLI